MSQPPQNSTSPEEMPLVEWADFGVEFHGETIVTRFSGALRRGQKVAVLGPNGSGKSSLLKALLGGLELSRSSGHGDRKIKWHITREQISYVPQTLDFDFHIPLTVREFLEISRIKSIWNFPWPWIRETITVDSPGSLNLTPLSPELLSTPLAQLSRGQIQTVILARAYLEKPICAFLDEPLTGLDRDRRSQIIHFIFNSTETLLMVAHDSDWMSFGFTHVLHLDLETLPKIVPLAEYLGTPNLHSILSGQS
jgi:ABC-type Mn2+/Zn2+ transport system ATPase subunit